MENNKLLKIRLLAVIPALITIAIAALIDPTVMFSSSVTEENQSTVMLLGAIVLVVYVVSSRLIAKAIEKKEKQNTDTGTEDS